MPRYFFDIVGGVDDPDPEGTTFESADEVRRQAVEFAGELLKSEGEQFWGPKRLGVRVRDERGQAVLTLSVSGDLRE